MNISEHVQQQKKKSNKVHDHLMNKQYHIFIYQV